MSLIDRSVLERTYRELRESRMISDLALSPADGTAAFLVRRIDFSGNRYRTALFRQRRDEEPRSLGGGAWSDVLWTKGGKLVGVQRAPKGVKPLQISRGGSVERERLIPGGGKPVELLDNGDCVLQTRISGNRTPGLVFTDEYPIFHNDFGLAANTRGALLFCDGAANKVRRITEETFSVSMSAADLERDLIVAAGKEYAQTPQLPDEIRVYSARSRLTKRFLVGGKWDLSHLLLWNGKIVFAGIDGRQGVLSAPRLMQIDPVTGELTVLSPEDVCLGNRIATDLRFGGGKSIAAGPEGLYASVTRGERSELCLFTREKGWQTLCGEMDTVDMLDAAGGRVLFSGFVHMQRPELFEYRPDGSMAQLTRLQPPLPGPAPRALSAAVEGMEIRGSCWSRKLWKGAGSIPRSSATTAGRA